MLGLTVFESVLERLKAEARQAEEEAGDTPDDDVSGAVRGLPSGFAGLGAGTAFTSGAQAAAAYLDLGGEPPPPAEPPAPPAPPPPPPHLLRVAPEEIAADLALSGRESVEALLSRRRDFARENHPDRAPPELRANATLRMKIANMLIDETIRRIGTERRLGLKR